MVNIATYNVRGIAAYEKRRKIFKFIKTSPYDIIALQECHCTKKVEKIWRSQFGGQVFYSHGTSNSKGCMILIKRNIGTKIHKIIKDEVNGRYLLLDVSVGEYRFVLCNVYAPNEDDTCFFEEVLGKLMSLESQSIVLVGDLNTTLEKIDKKSVLGLKPGHPKSTEFIKMMMTKLNLIDIFRTRHPDCARYTWFKTKPYLLMERLDYILVSNNLTSYILTTDIDPTFMSDHAIPHVTLKDVAEATKGPGYWKLNVQHLQDQEFKEMVKNTLEDSIKQGLEGKLRWDFFKMKFRGEAIRYGARKKKSRENKLEALQNKLYRLQKEKDKVESIHLFKDVDDQMSLVQKDIQEIIQQKVMAASLTNQFNWYSAGEKSSKYFFSLENKFPRKPLLRIEIENKIINDSDEILDQLKQYYANLFTQIDGVGVDHDFLRDIELPQISVEDKDILEKPISLAEVEIAIKQMNKEKCPGLDGIPVELYQEMIEDFKYVLHDLFLKCVSEDELNNSAKLGVVSLLEKPGLDQLKLTNWRPLSLLCGDYKVFAKILANRLSMVTPDIISEDQTGFLKNRFIAQNLMDLNMVIQTANDKEIQAVVLAIDFEKAYDTVCWKAMYSILKSFGFGENFIKMVKICQTDISTAIMNNGYRSESFKLTRGLRQGCPLSCLLFDCVVEILGAKIRQCDNIEGFVTLNGKQKKLAQYADDLWVSMKHKYSCYKALFEILQQFSLFAGLCVNYNKTEILRIGSLRGSDARFYSEFPLHWTDGPIKILGLWTSSDVEQMSIQNFDRTLQKASNICKIWSKRLLSLLGKILLVNTLIVPLFTYRLMVTRTPKKNQFLEYKKLITNFIWDNKHPQIAYDKLIKDYDQGGLRLFDLKIKDTAIKTKWMQVAKFKESSLWSQALVETFKMEPGLILECNLCYKDICKITNPTIVRDVMLAWSKINYRTPTSKKDVLNQILWYNSHIKIRNSTLFLKRWYTSGIVRIQQIWDDGRFKTCNELVREYGNVINIIDLTNITQAIPKEWLLVIKKEVSTDVNLAAVDLVQSNLKCSKIVYDSIIAKKIDDKKAKNKSELELDCELDMLWHKLYQETVKLTLSTKLRVFQYKIINRYLVTNVRISKWNSEITPNCSFCQDDHESILHLLCECGDVKKLWDSLTRWLQHFCDLQVELTNFEIIFNRYKDVSAPMVNTLILITKYYIYVQRCLKKKLLFVELIEKIEKYKYIEFITAKSTNRLKKCKYKWSLYDMI